MPASPSQTTGRVVVGLSGGVDSAVAALRLQQAGYAVTGLFMKNWDEDDGTDDCTAQADLADAQQVADTLGIPLQVANFAAEYWDNVFEAFLTEYQAGRTPNPDVLCNREIKFRYFADYASRLGADFIATGHYARLEPGDAQRSTHRLLQARDHNKDQTYFLQGVSHDRFSNVLFPLGDLHKDEVRAIARRAGFANHRKKDSTGICFIGERRFRSFLSRYLPAQEGPILTEDGAQIGTHPGAHLYTIGQRQGLGIGGVAGHSEAPWYVAAKRLDENTLIVTQQLRALDSLWLTATDANWMLAAPPEFPMIVKARIRHRQTLADCQVTADGEGLRVTFPTPMRAVNPGQYIAFYSGEQCLGGALITGAQPWATRLAQAAA
ncbi:MAG: tRNA 2-thiouridine(34) synthase MnmA [Pseudomonadota bacterium]